MNRVASYKVIFEVDTILEKVKINIKTVQGEYLKKRKIILQLAMDIKYYQSYDV